MSYFTSRLAAGLTTEQLDTMVVLSPEYLHARAGSAADGFLDALFGDALQRAVEPKARSYYDGLLAQGMSRGQIADIVFTSDEYRRDQVDGWYQHFIEKPIDAATKAIYLGQLQAGMTDEQVISQLLASDDYYAKTAS
jgi:hypothetical protein